ncbi:MAG: hypothetical protein PQJ61_12365 [Spirochaetales bacterium]|uniref:DUF8091 domain-containing protein n=1 Tax=Candidatus Thalassospirochaeta sargassi TaxID=3119039 RepID=A0AAJ1IHW5_9SPIO|nr:hypothetical protein [Spirochaetales bacterium]
MNKPIIGGLNEKSLHRQLKEYYCTEESLMEEKVEGFVIDVVNPDGLVEVQTSNFSGMKKKLKVLLPGHPVRLIHPVAAETMISVYNKDGSLKTRRRSPKRGTIRSAAAELLYIADLIPNPNLTVEIPLVRQEEIRCDDGKGSWRRKGVSIEDRLLVEVIESRCFQTAADYLSLLPDDLPDTFGNKDIADTLGGGKAGRTRLAGQITWLLRRLELVQICGKEGNRLLFQLNPKHQS